MGLWHITTASLTQSVSLPELAYHALIVPLLYQKNNSHNQCVFIKGFRAKRRFFWTVPIRAAAEPLSDGPDKGAYSEIQVARVPDAPKVGSLPLPR